MIKLISRANDLRRIILFTGLILSFKSHEALCAQNQDTLKVGYYDTAPFIYQTRDGLSGVNIWLWDQIADQLGIQYVLIELPLNEIVRGLETNAIDVSIVPLSITSDRSAKFDFSPPYYIANSTVLMQSGGSENKFWHFFTAIVNVGFLKAIGALVFIIFVFGVLVWFFERKRNDEHFGKGIKGMLDGLWWSAVTMTTVGYGDKYPKTVGGKAVALIWMFVAIIVISGFLASITSSLTVSKMSWSYDDIQDLKEQRLGTISESATEKWLRNNFFSDVSTFYDLDQLTNALDARQIDAIAFDEPALKYLIKNDKSRKYDLLPISYNRQLYSLGYAEQLDHDLKEAMSSCFVRRCERPNL